MILNSYFSFKSFKVNYFDANDYALNAYSSQNSDNKV
jgi:hypothetical protein